MPLYCRQCSYSLEGLAEGRCPECGGAFDLKDPRTYRDAPRRNIWRFFIWMGIVIVLLLILDNGIDKGQGYYSCGKCGAQSRARWLKVFGFGGEYERSINCGVLCTLVEEQMHRPCDHAWRTHSTAGGGFLHRYVGCGGGRIGIANVMDWASRKFDVRAFMYEQASMEPEFWQRFVQAVQDPQAEPHNEFLSHLAERLTERMQTESERQRVTGDGR